MGRLEWPPKGGSAGADSSRSADWRAAESALTAYLYAEPFEAPATLSRDEPDLRVFQLVLRALAVLDGDTAAAVAQARQAARAARTEAIPAMEYLAYWTLARARRGTGKPHASALIVAACARAAPSHWHPLIDWELVLAGSTGDIGGSMLDRPLADPAQTWRAVLRDPSEATLDRLRALPLPPRFARERDVLASGFDAVAVADEPLAFRMAAALTPTATGTPAVWEVDPSGCRLRWARAAGTATAQISMEEGERTIAAIAVLARAQAGLPVEEFFQRVYGFGFRQAIHGGALRTLVHRVRSALGDSATLERVGDELRLEARGRFLCPALASAPTLEDRLLRLIALAPGVGARELSEHVDANLRTVQRALRSLASSGACDARQDGRSLTYAVEDTTFSEPTHFKASSDASGDTGCPSC